MNLYELERENISFGQGFFEIYTAITNVSNNKTN